MENTDAVRMGWAAVLGLVAAGGNLLGGYFVVRREWPRKFLQYFLALGAGYMLAVALVEIIPESVKLGGQNAFTFVLAGFFLIHFGEETHEEEFAKRNARRAVLLGLAIHAFFDGVAIAAGFLVSTWLGAVIFIAVFLHKLPEGFTVASMVLASGQGRKSALRAAATLGGATLVGVALTGVLRTELQYALPLAGGVTLYVAGTDLLPEVNREPNWRMALLVFVGVATMLILQRLAAG
jgi:ZIP family zinc transporter/zinc and cadmium transporter